MEFWAQIKMVLVLMVELVKIGLVMRLEKLIEISKELRLSMLLEGLIVTEINSANLSSHQ